MRSTLTALALLALALGGCSLTDPLKPVASVEAVSVADAGEAAALISAYRASKGLGPVSVDPHLNAVAEHQARAVAAAGTLSHGAFASRMSAYGVPGHAAENLTAGSRSVADAVARWRASPAHDANLLMSQARRIGLARADSPTRYGRYWALVLAQ
jgi:uncharacterized protein YkwD